MCESGEGRQKSVLPSTFLPEARQYGFSPIGKEIYTNEVLFSPQELANYLMTQSNIIAAVEQGTERAESTYTWLVEQLVSLFPVSRGTFLFGGVIEYLQKEY